jgi:hypothetical protein
MEDLAMTFVKTLAVGTFLASTLVAGTAFAKGHNNGFGAGAKGSLAGQIDDGQSNRDGRGSETTYGLTDAVPDAKDGVAGNSVDARNRDAANHPSNK